MTRRVRDPEEMTFNCCWGRIYAKRINDGEICGRRPVVRNSGVIKEKRPWRLPLLSLQNRLQTRAQLEVKCNDVPSVSVL
ncbi:hypothetical protein TNCV_1903161 [Trichonephila clavipes]|nr:hypothetical protein TNCV_1903161 [Trichonephila clavipes]